MGRKVEENHKVIEQNSHEAAEDLIKQQNSIGDFVLGENEEEPQQEEAQQKEVQQEGDTDSSLTEQEERMKEFSAEPTRQEEIQQEKVLFEGVVILTGAATYLDSGTRYFKNKPAKITDRRVYEQLIRTGLFAHF